MVNDCGLENFDISILRETKTYDEGDVVATVAATVEEDSAMGGTDIENCALSSPSVVHPSVKVLLIMSSKL
jgi:hypothetical protein